MNTFLSFFIIVPFGLLKFDLFVVLYLTWTVQELHKWWEKGKVVQTHFMVTNNNDTFFKRRSCLEWLANLKEKSKQDKKPCK